MTEVKRTEKKKTERKNRAKGIVFAAVLLLLAAVVLLRYMRTAGQSGAGETVPESVPVQPTAAAVTETPPPATPPIPEAQHDLPAPTAEDSAPELPESTSLPTVRPQPETKPEREHVYTEQSYQLVTDVVYTMRNRGEEGEATIRGLVQELKDVDPELGALWEAITDYWFYVCSEFTVCRGILPDGLPTDDSLCIAVLGFQLLYDGEMAPELIGRCEIALACAQKYPDAFLLVTGGGTAAGNHAATEADVMAQWLKEKGIPEERIIIENRSLTTDQNASNSCAILAEQYPQIRELAIVSSDYHVALGSMLFTEAALLYGYENGCEPPYQVVSNAGFATSGNPEYSDPRRFSSDIWVMADPTY